MNGSHDGDVSSCVKRKRLGDKCLSNTMLVEFKILTSVRGRVNCLYRGLEICLWLWFRGTGNWPLLLEQFRGRDLNYSSIQVLVESERRNEVTNRYLWEKDPCKE